MKITKKETVYDGHYRLQLYTVNDGKNEFTREVFHTGTAAAAIVFDTVKQQYVFAKQFRPPLERDLLEIVAGMLDSDDEKPEDAIVREIEEEIGYAVDKLEFIAEVHPSPGAVVEKNVIFYAEVSHKKSEGGGKDDENEDIEALYFSPESLRNHTFVDAKTLIAVQWVLAHKLTKQ